MARTTAPLVWDFYREIPGATGLGSTIEYYNEDAQAIYIDGGLRTRTTKVEDGHWSDTVLGTEIALTETLPTSSAWDHPATGQLVGVGVEGAEFVIYRYAYAKDLSELVRSGTWKTRDDSQIAQAALTLANAGEDVVLADSTLFEPGAKLALAVAMGDSALYPIGTAWLDDVDFDAHAQTFPLSGRNTIGYRLNGQTFDNDTEFTGNGHEVVAWILGLAGVTDYEIGPSDYSQTWTFEPSDTLYKGLQKVFEFFAPWNMLELPDGKIVVGYPAFLAQYQANSVYQFRGGTEIFRRKTKKAADAAYSKVRVTGKAADGTELTPVLLSVQAFSHWSLGSHKTKHVKAADGMTQAELQAYAEQLAAELAHIGVGESFTGPMRPWLLCGDVASISWDGQTSEDLGLVTSITQHFGMTGFSTDFAVDSGGVAVINRSSTAVTASAAVNGYNRHQDLADLIGVIGTGKDGKDGAKGEQGDPGEAGATGPAGPQGPAGPNEVSSTTATDLTGVLAGNGSTVTTKPVDAAPDSSHTANLISSAAVAAALAAAGNFAAPTWIADSTDLNTLSSPGCYRTSTATRGKTMINAPWATGSSAGEAFVLFVVRNGVNLSASNDYYLQILVTPTTVWTRRHYDNLYSDWTSQRSIDDADTTLTGVLAGNGSGVETVAVDQTPTSGNADHLVSSAAVASALSRFGSHLEYAGHFGGATSGSTYTITLDQNQRPFLVFVFRDSYGGGTGNAALLGLYMGRCRIASGGSAGGLREILASGGATLSLDITTGVLSMTTSSSYMYADIYRI